MAEILIGTCSWSQHEGYYPEGLPANEQISYYAREFPVVELNSTFYRMMPRRNFELWAERTPEGFLFDVKPYRQLTWHDRKHPPDDEVAVAFRELLQPLRDADKLGAVHFQFPPWFTYEAENLAYIRHVHDLFADDVLSVEFRHRSWLEGEALPEVIAALEEEGISLTVVDEPQLGSGSVPTVLTVTNPELVIIRFHGRNYQQWYAKVKSSSERFDYLYSQEELEEWVPKIDQLAQEAREIHALFNNNAQDYPVRNARQLRVLLEQRAEQATVVPAQAQG
ncbi:MAG TPA: DUF72 domain-containing protein [Chloroflexi bacterium]|jgi:uncharacterized protein YecE (DUF72 family)|nr:DUF72 domain-containing protein [Chloroflexota bacterium]